jgi:type III pantothenate kinase
MLLAVDAGNTNTVFALYDNDKDVGIWRMMTNAQRTADEYAVFLGQLMQEKVLPATSITAAIIGSVVPDANFHLRKLCREHYNCEPLFVGAPDVDLGLKILLNHPQEVGADRLINAVAGVASFKPPLLIIDFGTATTFDVVDENGSYYGGIIAPGVNLSLDALHRAAAKLPHVALTRPANVIGKGTIEAIQSGVFWGYVSLVEGMIARIRKEFGRPMTVMATGGLAALFRDVIPALEHIDPDLTLRGLQLIYLRNRKNNIHEFPQKRFTSSS